MESRQLGQQDSLHVQFEEGLRGHPYIMLTGISSVSPSEHLACMLRAILVDFPTDSEAWVEGGDLEARIMAGVLLT